MARVRAVIACVSVASLISQTGKGAKIEMAPDDSIWGTLYIRINKESAQFPSRERVAQLLSPLAVPRSLAINNTGTRALVHTRGCVQTLHRVCMAEE